MFAVVEPIKFENHWNPSARFEWHALYLATKHPSTADYNDRTRQHPQILKLKKLKT